MLVLLVLDTLDSVWIYSILPTCERPLFAPLDSQLLLLLPPQMQQESRSRDARVVAPAQDLRRGVWVVAEFQQGGQNGTVDTSGT